MKKTTIRELKHQTTAVLERVAKGETVEVCRRNEPVAVLSPPSRKSRVARPDFAARLRAIYGTKKLPTTGSDLVSEARGESGGQVGRVPPDDHAARALRACG